MELKDLRNLAGLNECGGMMPMSGESRTPASLSVTAASGPELSGMLKDLMSLAGLHKVEPEHLGAEPAPMKMTAEPVKAVGPAASDSEVMRGIADKLNPEKDVKADEAWDNTPAGAEPTEQFDSNEFADHPNPPGAGKNRGVANNPRGTVESKLWEDYNNFVESDIESEDHAEEGLRRGSGGSTQHNFTADDLANLATMGDLEAMKARALELISTPSQRPMKPEKIEWFKRALAGMQSSKDVIKLMYDLLLSGEGLGVVGSRKSAAYHDRFKEANNDSMDEGEVSESAISAATSRLKNAISKSLDKKGIKHSWKGNDVVAVDDERKEDIQGWLDGLINPHGIFIQVIGNSEQVPEPDEPLGGDDDFDADSSYAEPRSKSYSDDDSDDWGSDRM